MPIHCEFDITQRTLNFPRSFVDCPRLAHGLRMIDIGKDAAVRVSSTLQHLTKSSADCNIITWAETKLYHAVTSVLALAPCDLDFLTGEHTRSFWNHDPASVRIDFERPFVTPPKVVVFFNCINLLGIVSWHFSTTATDIDMEGFTLNIASRADDYLYTIRVGWIAYPEDRGHIFSTSVSTLEIRPPGQQQRQHSKEISFNSVEFLQKPSVFIALNLIDISTNANLRVNAYVDSISTTRLVWHIDSWADTVLNNAGATIIAFTSN
ncbi:hypothetical protein H4582DRAFT_2103020 [Lactarius indigo]|nr:hypothetical protein H4582DRAFT_2103020 [Lactarius indigo]